MSAPCLCSHDEDEHDPFTLECTADDCLCRCYDPGEPDDDE